MRGLIAFLFILIGVISLSVGGRSSSLENVPPSDKGAVVYMDDKSYSDPDETMRYTVNCVIMESTDCFIENGEYITLEECVNVEVRNCRNLFISGCKNMIIQGLSDQTLVCDSL
jgi:hypothetical protein